MYYRFLFFVDLVSGLFLSWLETIKLAVLATVLNVSSNSVLIINESFFPQCRYFPILHRFEKEHFPMKRFLSTLFCTLLAVGITSGSTDPEYQYCGSLINQRVGNLLGREVLVPPDTPTIVKTGLTVVMNKGIKDANQMLTMTVLVSMKWVDHRIATLDLNCNKKSWKFVLESTKFLPWYPHFTIANSASTVIYEDGWRYYPSLVFANGTVSWIQEYQIETICMLQLTFFPFDNQFCNFELKSPHYNSSVLQYEVENRDLAVQLVSESAATASVWRLIGQNYETIEGDKPGLVFKLNLQRRPSFYMCCLMFPTLIINIMTCATFVLSPTFEEKPQCAQSCLLAYLLLTLIFYAYGKFNQKALLFFNLF